MSRHKGQPHPFMKRRVYRPSHVDFGTQEAAVPDGLSLTYDPNFGYPTTRVYTSGLVGVWYGLRYWWWDHFHKATRENRKKATRFRTVATR